VTVVCGRADRSVDGEQIPVDMEYTVTVALGLLVGTSAHKERIRKPYRTERYLDSGLCSRGRFLTTTELDHRRRSGCDPLLKAPFQALLRSIAIVWQRPLSTDRFWVRGPKVGQRAMA